MDNPFSSLLGMLGNGGGGPSQNQPGQGGATPPSNTSPTPSPTSGGGFLGLGGLMQSMGIQTKQQVQAANDAKIFQALTSQMQQGGSPQQAILKFLQTPDGVQLMTRPGASDTLERWSKTITPPPPTAIQTAPGNNSQIYQSGQKTGEVNQPPAETQNFRSGVPTYVNTGPGGQTTQFTKGQPTANINQTPVETQNFFNLGKGANVPENIMQVLAQGQMGGPNSQLPIAVANLVKSGVIDQAMGDKLLGGMVSIMRGLNESGEETSQYFQIDKASGHVTPLNPQSIGGTPTVSIPATTPGNQPLNLPATAFNQDGSINGNYLTATKYMGLGSGALNHALTIAGHVVRTFDPTNPDANSQIASVRHDQLDQLKTSLAALGAERNGRLRVMTDLWLDQATSKWTDPVDAYNGFLAMNNRLRTLMATELGNIQRAQGPNGNHEEAKMARSTIDAIQNALSAMPTKEDSEWMLGELKKGTAPVTTLGTVGSSAWTLGSGVVGAVAGAVSGQGNQPVNPGRSLPQQVREPGATLPTSEGATPKPQDFSKMSPQDLAAAYSTLPPGPSEARAAYNDRLRALGAGKGKAKPTTGKGNPPASSTDNGPLEYSGNGPKPTPSVQQFTQNPTGGAPAVKPQITYNKGDRAAATVKGEVAPNQLDDIFKEYLKQRTQATGQQ
jgi:hypothetical protein